MSTISVGEMGYPWELRSDDGFLERERDYSVCV